MTGIAAEIDALDLMADYANANELDRITKALREAVSESEN